jgi:uncharacterized protein (TIGR02646 family)
MRYIKKGKEPQTLQAIKGLAQRTGQLPAFEALPANVVYEIVQALLYDQGWLCCYCMNEISSETSRLVHFLPFKDEALTYTNMYLACNYSNHLPPAQQHCYIKKGTDLIPKYMSDDQCAEYFRYNTLGEILPNGPYRTIRKCQDNFRSLTPVQQAVLSAIEILNLNTERLKDQRKAVLTEVANAMRKITKAQIPILVKNLNQKDKNGRLRRFCEVMIYYLKSA